MPETAENSDANPDQAEYWNSGPGKKWIGFQEILDTVFLNVSERLVERSNPERAEKILDIGCGTGALTMEFASQVGPRGLVFGVDISGPLVGRAEERRSDNKFNHVEFMVSDAQTQTLPPSRFDLMASRFGVMFFSDPVAAFKNLSLALRPGGRLSFVSWADVDINPWFTIPRDAAIQRLGKPAPAPANAPSPFAFADTGYVLDILKEAGFSNGSADVEKVDLFLPGAMPGVLSEFAYLSSNIGAATRIVKELDGGPEDVAFIEQEAAKGFQQYVTNEGVSVPATVNFYDAVKS